MIDTTCVRERFTANLHSDLHTQHYLGKGRWDRLHDKDSSWSRGLGLGYMFRGGEVDSRLCKQVKGLVHEVSALRLHQITRGRVLNVIRR